jgi:hypothetical protein
MVVVTVGGLSRDIGKGADMIAAVVFGIAAAVFVFSTAVFVHLAGLPDPLGDKRLSIWTHLVLVAVSAGTMYAVASGRWPLP